MQQDNTGLELGSSGQNETLAAGSHFDDRSTGFRAGRAREGTTSSDGSDM